VQTDKIYLVGFMASGKSTVARALGRRLDWRVEDVDDRIEAREGRTVASIFAREGEAYFRSAERSVLVDLLLLRHTVVATGGGTFVDPENRAAINRDGLSVWLDVPLDDVIRRIPADGRRPLAADRDQLERLYALRRIAYQQAHLHLDAGQIPVDGLVEQVLDMVER
jgi:shikimate kinase